MRKLLLSIIILLSISFTFAQDCQYLFFSEYVEGTANSKGIEIYNPTDQPIDLADYVVVRYSNGSNSAEPGYKADLQGTISAYGTWVLVNGQITTSETSPACDPELQALADQLDGEYPAPMYMNGNDAITLEKKNGVVYDIFGKVGEDPVTGWCDVDSLNYVTGAQYWWLAWTKDHTLRRKPSVKHGVFINPGDLDSDETYFRVHVEWDTAPGELVGDTAWVSANVWDDLGQHDCDCETTAIHEYVKQKEVYFFPNPVTNQTFTIKGTDIITSVEIYNVIGQTVFKKENEPERGDMRINLDIKMKGMFMAKVSFKDNTYIIKKFLVK